MLFLRNLDPFKEELIIINPKYNFTTPKTIFWKSLVNYSYIRIYNYLKQVRESRIFELNDLKDLTSLHYSNHQLTNIPENFSLPNLQALWLNNNELTNFSGLFSLPKLLILDIGYNKLTNFPECVAFLNLVTLWIDCNQLTEFPENLSLPNLKQLNLSHNQLTNFVCKIPKLEKLWLDNNLLTDFNYVFSNLESFEELTLFSNNLTETTKNKIRNKYKKITYLRL